MQWSGNQKSSILGHFIPNIHMLDDLLKSIGSNAVMVDVCSPKLMSDKTRKSLITEGNSMMHCTSQKLTAGLEAIRRQMCDPGPISEMLFPPSKISGHLPREVSDDSGGSDHIDPDTPSCRNVLHPTPSGPLTAIDNEVTSVMGEREYLVYLVRHGEASHNVVEKAAKRKAKEKAEQLGLQPAEIKEHMEQARMAVLVDETLRDAPLSEQGRQDAVRTRKILEQLIQNRGLPAPSKILVSPLTRTLETADRVFPDHERIHVREEIQERQTGNPCDCRSSSRALSNRESFERFSMDALKDHPCSDAREALEAKDSVEEDGNECEDGDGLSLQQGRSQNRMSDPQSDRPCANRTNLQRQENRAMLRTRTKQLLSLLDEPSIAVVSHKGFLRELERGTLGNPGAEEFDNGEIRAYRIHLNEDKSLKYAARII